MKFSKNLLNKFIVLTNLLFIKNDFSKKIVKMSIILLMCEVNF